MSSGPLIYFASHLRSGREDELDRLCGIYALLSEHGFVLSDLPSDTQGPEGDYFVYKRDIERLRQADVLFAEVSNSDSGVGFLVGQAVAQGKQVVALYRAYPGLPLSPVIAGCPDVQVVAYDEVDDLRRSLAALFPVSV